jgi:hypothetical protein
LRISSRSSHDENAIKDRHVINIRGIKQNVNEQNVSVKQA